jgi:hypothetical protein
MKDAAVENHGFARLLRTDNCVLPFMAGGKVKVKRLRPLGCGKMLRWVRKRDEGIG